MAVHFDAGQRTRVPSAFSRAVCGKNVQRRCCHLGLARGDAGTRAGWCVGAMATAATHRCGGAGTTDQTPARFTRAEVAARAANGAMLCVVNHVVIDLTGFAHPGGQTILAKHNGTDVTTLFGGKQADEKRRYAHSEGARRMLDGLKVGVICDDEEKVIDETSRRKTTYRRERVFLDLTEPRAQAHAPSSVGSDDGEDGGDGNTSEGVKEGTKHTQFSVDMTKPLWKQVGVLGARGEYESWVYTPTPDSLKSNGSNTTPLRFFDNDLVEALSRSPWWSVPAVWVPVAAHAVYEGRRNMIQNENTVFGLLALVAAFTLGWRLWIFMEYFTHRCVFHHIYAGAWGAQAHFAMHGCHHKAPMDVGRLTFPPTAFAPLVFLFKNLFAAVASLLVKATDAYFVSCFLFAGCLSAYVVYDMTHYAFHVCDASRLRKITPKLGVLKSKHMTHHYRDHRNSFGISSQYWDNKCST